MTNRPAKCHPVELTCIAAFLTCLRIFTDLPRIFTQLSGTGAPLSSLISGLVTSALLFLLYICFITKEDESLLNLAQRSLGSFGKYAASAILLGYLASSFLFTLREFSEFAKLLAFPTAPLWFVSLFFCISAILGAVRGGTGILRLFCFFAPAVSVIILLLLATNLLQSDISNLFPLLGTGEIDTFGKSLFGAPLYSDLLLLFLLPRSSSKKASGRAVFWGSALGIIITFASVTAFTAKIPYPLSQTERFPLYLLTKEVYYGRFFQRIDAIILLSSALWGMLSLSLNLHLSASIAEEAFFVKFRFSVIFPMAAALFFTCTSLGTAQSEIPLSILEWTALGTFIFISATILFSPKKEAISNET